MENNELMLKHYGTTDNEKIKLMMESLYKEKRTQRIELFAFRHPEMDRFKCIKFITDFAKRVGRERAILKDNSYQGNAIGTERIIFDLDKQILTNSLLEQGYSQEEAEELVEISYTVEDIWGIKSLNAEDYTVYGGVLVQKPEKERYARLLDMQAGNEATK